MITDTMNRLIDVAAAHVDHMRKAWHSVHVHEFSRRTSQLKSNIRYEDLFIKDIAQGEFDKLYPLEMEFEKLRNALSEHGLELKIHCPLKHFKTYEKHTFWRFCKDILLPSPPSRTFASDFYPEATIYAANNQKKQFAIGMFSRPIQADSKVELVGSFEELKQRTAEFLEKNGGAQPHKPMIIGESLREKHVYDVAKLSTNHTVPLARDVESVVEQAIVQASEHTPHTPDSQNFWQRCVKKVNPFTSKEQEIVKNVEQNMVGKSAKLGAAGAVFSIVAGVVCIPVAGFCINKLFGDTTKTDISRS